MRLVHARIGEIDVIGGHQRKAHRIGHLDKAPLGQPFGLGRAILDRVALQLYIKPVCERRQQLAHQRLGRRALPGLQQAPHWPIRPTRQADHPLGMRLELGQRDMRQLPVAAQIETRVELHQVLVARLVLRQQNQRRRRLGPLARLGLEIIQIDLTTHDRLDARPARGDGKLQCGEHVVGVGHRDRRHPRLLAQARQRLEPHSTLQQGIFGMDAKVDESGGTAHAPQISRPRAPAKATIPQGARFLPKPQSKLPALARKSAPDHCPSRHACASHRSAAHHNASGDRVTASLLAISGLTKAYPGVIANDDVSFDIGPGEVHALLGENGAGKSTLVKMIYGLVKPDSGTMTLHGASYTPPDPHAARKAGVAMVFQHFSLFEAMSVAENVALGMEEPPRLRDLATRIREVSETYGLPLDPGRIVGDLSAGERQRVEIIRCLLQDPRLLIMDEPTSVLTPQEVEILFQTLRKLSGEGVAILYISHKLEEIRSLCDQATILRQGRNVGTCLPRETSARAMAEMMVGSSFAAPERAPRAPGAVALDITGLSVASPSAFGTALKDIHLTVQAGEILGLGGVAGNGQDELLAALSGEILSD